MGGVCGVDAVEVAAVCMVSPSDSLMASVMESVLGRLWWLPSSDSAALSFEGCLGLGLSRPHFFSTGSRYFFNWSPMGEKKWIPAKIKTIVTINFTI